jgi:diaminohydroxyphosphoribosylaminopyrimidine deaminase/5-amino-6-(5-phosphoribosylamino)uracil reductase
MLDCRVDSNKKIKKVILDARGRTPAKANIFKYSLPEDIFIFTSRSGQRKLGQLKKNGVNIISLQVEKTIPVKNVLKTLYGMGVMSVLVEGGSAVFNSFLGAKAVDQAWLYVAPVIIGEAGLPLAKNYDFTNPGKTFKMSGMQVEKIGRDLLFKGDVTDV